MTDEQWVEKYLNEGGNSAELTDEALANYLVWAKSPEKLPSYPAVGSLFPQAKPTTEPFQLFSMMESARPVSTITPQARITPTTPEKSVEEVASLKQFKRAQLALGEKYKPEMLQNFWNTYDKYATKVVGEKAPLEVMEKAPAIGKIGLWLNNAAIDLVRVIPDLAMQTLIQEQEMPGKGISSLAVGIPPFMMDKASKLVVATGLNHFASEEMVAEARKDVAENPGHYFMVGLMVKGALAKAKSTEAGLLKAKPKIEEIKGEAPKVEIPKIVERPKVKEEFAKTIEEEVSRETLPEAPEKPYTTAGKIAETIERGKIKQELIDLDAQIENLRVKREADLPTNYKMYDDQIRAIGEQKIIVVEKMGGTDAVVENFYQLGRQAQKQAGQKGVVAVEVPKIKLQVPEAVSHTFQVLKQTTQDLQYYPEAGISLRNEIRTNPIRIQHEALAERLKIDTAIYGVLNKAERKLAADIVYARNEVGRQKAGVGNPNLTLEQATEILQRFERQVKNPEVISASERFRTISDVEKTELVKRGHLEAGEGIEDYARQYVLDYTPEWSPTISLGRKVRTPFRPEFIKAKGTVRAYRTTPESLVDQIMEVRFHNKMEDWVKSVGEKYDIGAKLTEAQKKTILGDKKVIRFQTEAGDWVSIDPIKHLKPGRILDIAGKRYRVWSPDKPYSRQLYPVEFEQIVQRAGEEVKIPRKAMALGTYKRTYILPENVYKTLEKFRNPGGSPFMYWVNRINAYGKSMAILSGFVSFTKNNMLGDIFLKVLMHPEPIKFSKSFFGKEGSLKWMTTKPQNYTPYQQTFAQFLQRNAVLDASFALKELPHIYQSKNPLKIILAGAQRFSAIRENISRLADAKYLFDELRTASPEKITELRKYYRFIDQYKKDLTNDQAFGKIAREVGAGDYGAISDVYKRWIRGLALPFGTWYLKVSPQLLKFVKAHPLKAIAGLSAAPVLTTIINNRSKKIQELDMSLSDDYRNNIHITIGENIDGSVKVITTQLPQDALIGTKLFSIAANKLNQLAHGKITLKEAAVETLKDWGVREAEGIAYLLTPMYRFFEGQRTGRDPWSKRRIYPYDKDEMTDTAKAKYLWIYFAECFVPPLGRVYYEEHAKVIPKDKAVEKALRNFMGWGALGVRDVYPEVRVEFPYLTYKTKPLTYETSEELKTKITKEEKGILADIRDSFVKSGEMLPEYLKSEKYISLREKLKDLHGGRLTEEGQISLLNKVINRIVDETTLKQWAYNMLLNAKTDEEKKYWGEMYRTGRYLQFFKALRQLPITTREHLPEVVAPLKSR